ncbi:MAG: phenylalanine--tRNA ligase subunit beta [Minisyncoccia bacterium]|jgi:phenylalanyl-tRNA synthetase beta chain
MKVSLSWLEKYFNSPLPNGIEVAGALTFHAFEIEDASYDMLDVKVLPNRAADCFCHRGIAKELSAILNIPLKNDPLREPLQEFPKTNAPSVTIENPKKCLRYIGAVVKGVKIKPSPDWLRKTLEAVGQRSINNIVDATNYVMLDIGQPLHAFDAGKLTQKDGHYAIKIRDAKREEKITVLSEEEYTLPSSVLLIVDANSDAAIGIAGVKGGKTAEITENTVDIIVESANFDGTTIRRAAQALKLSTEASVRFQNRPSPELCAYGMRNVLALIQKIAGGEVIGVVDKYPTPAGENKKVFASLEKINGVLGSDFSKEEVRNVFKRLDLDTKVEGKTFTITPPFERTDLTIPEDLAEEVGRIIGYDKISPQKLPALAAAPDQARFRGIEKMKDQLVEQGFTEISTQSFAEKGDIYLANPLDKTKPALRKSSDENMKEALERAKNYAPLVLAPNQKLKLFEIGTVFPKEGEQLAVETSEPVPDMPPIQDAPEYIPKQYHLGAYKPFSIYPFILRDIAFWAPSNSDIMDLRTQILLAGENLLLRVDSFDIYPKEGDESVTSFAFRLVFESPSKTLTDDEVNAIMQKITSALSAKGYEVR